MEMLRDIGDDEATVAYALKESVSSVLEVASTSLAHHPPALIRHLLTQPSANDAGLYIRFHVARGNFLYAEDTIREVYAARRSLTLDVIEAIGRAYFRSLAPQLRRYLSAELELYEDARELKGPKSVAGVDGIRSGIWSRAGWSALLSAIALVRLDADCDVDQIRRLLNEADAIQSRIPQRQLYNPDKVSRKVLGTRAFLEWVLFDKRVHQAHKPLLLLIKAGAIEVLPDLGTTLLKQGNERLLRKIVRKHSLVYFIESEFCFWPLMNWLHVNGFIAKNEYARGSLEQFWNALARGIAPPPWWQWR